MSLFLHIWLIFFTCNLLSFDGQLIPEEYDRKLIFGDNKLGLSLLGDISYFYFSKPSLLAKNCNTFQYVQQIYDLVLGYAVEDYLLAKVDLRSRILWGSDQYLVIGNSLNFLGAGYGGHDHDIENKNFFLVTRRLGKFRPVTLYGFDQIFEFNNRYYALHGWSWYLLWHCL